MTEQNRVQEEKLFILEEDIFFHIFSSPSNAIWTEEQLQLITELRSTAGKSTVCEQRKIEHSFSVQNGQSLKVINRHVDKFREIARMYQTQ